ncbi:DUF5665 domain-containing protein [Paenibacillus turpanensis]|uniref:DUF5665 domain-containing protein n=1 Tax=Paenibacillus turpanensis TaxID=2689078 RepID=UPI001FB717CD|nr:DUF5665 domain-containing protein [Paenibacillus turpanensis]
MAELNKRLAKVAEDMERTQIADYVQLLNSPRKLVFTNLLAGTARGVGIAIGFTIFTGTIVYLLNLLGALNLPIIGDYIAELVKHVQRDLNY